MSDEMIVRHCSPTLAGLKTGNLFNCPCSDKKELILAVRSLNKRLAPKGIRVIPIQVCEQRVLIYLYRPDKLENDLAVEEAGEILRACGYSTGDCDKCVVRLSRRLQESGDFPHEIGLFLGYPPEDVKGFMEKGANECKCTGMWKVYGNVEEAQRLFKQYKKCVDIYLTLFSEGREVKRLIVAS